MVKPNSGNRALVIVMIIEGHATRGVRPLRLMWLRSTLACTPHGAGRRTELSRDCNSSYHATVGGWKEEMVFDRRLLINLTLFYRCHLEHASCS